MALGWDDALYALVALLGSQQTYQHQSKEAKRNRAFQRSMSDSQHQREAMDYRAAGLNPILSGTGGPGASTPSGNMPLVPDFGQSVNTALNAKMQRHQIKNVQANTAKTVTENKLLERNVPLAEIKGDFTENYLKRLYQNSAKEGGTIGTIRDQFSNSAKSTLKNTTVQNKLNLLKKYKNKISNSYKKLLKKFKRSLK